MDSNDAAADTGWGKGGGAAAGAAMPVCACARDGLRAHAGAAAAVVGEASGSPGALPSFSTGWNAWRRDLSAPSAAIAGICANGVVVGPATEGSGFGAGGQQ